VEKTRAKIRRRVWSLPPAVPASKVAGTDLGRVIVLDAHAMLVTAHSEKEHAAATFKHGFGFHRIAVWCDNAHELLAITLRPGTPIEQSTRHQRQQPEGEGGVGGHRHPPAGS